MKPIGLLAAIIDTAQRLQPATFDRKVKEYRRAGLPSQSMGEGVSGSSETILPAFDKADRRFNRLAKEHQRLLERIWVDIRAVESIEQQVLLVAPAVPDEPVFMCANPACSNPLEPGLKKGDCGRCRVHFHRHKARWPHESADVVVTPVCENRV